MTQEDQLAEFLQGFELFFAEARFGSVRTTSITVGMRSAPMIRRALRIASRPWSHPLQRTSIGGFLEILSMNQPENAYVEMTLLVADGLNYELFNDTAARYKFTEGTGALVDAMAKDGDFDVALNSSVASVQQSEAGVVVTTTDGDVVHAKRAVVTVPLNLLNSVSFEPPLSAAKQEASTLKHVGGGYKVFFEVEGDPGAVMTLSRSTDSPLIGSFTYKRGEQHSVLAGFSLEPGALDKSVDEWQTVLEEFIPGIKLLSTFGHDWGDDALSQGSWCTYRPGTIAKFANALPQQEGNLVFASGDHAQAWRGFIEGAIASGSSAALGIAKSLQE